MSVEQHMKYMKNTFNKREKELKHKHETRRVSNNFLLHPLSLRSRLCG